MDQGDKKIKHLEFIQGVINRMAANSFAYKGWAITLTSALAAISVSKDYEPGYLIIAIVPLVFFWGLDGYYLQQERLFRKLYDDVRKKKDVDFSMNTQKFQTQIDSWFTVCWSRTIAPLYLPILVLVVVSSVATYFQNLPKLG